MARILFVITEDWALITHRLHLVKEAIAEGHDVGLATRFSKHEDMLKRLGILTFHWNMLRGSLNPIAEIASLLELRNIVKKFKPNLIHAVAQKPVLYSGILKRFDGNFGFVAALGGVGFIFTSDSIKAKLLRPLISKLLRYCLGGKKTQFILQNRDNIRLFEDLGIVETGFTKLVSGSGVEIDLYKPTDLPKGTPVIILPARMLWDKGVAEFVSAAKAIKEKGIAAEFILVGDIDNQNSNSVKQSHIDKWVLQKIILHWSRQDDMVSVYAKSSIVCLPSYHEGLPKVLLEAASCGRPIIAFDVPGSREIVKDRENGFLVPFKDSCGLEAALIALITNRELCKTMGKVGRQIVESDFVDTHINRKTFDIWREIL